MTLSERLLRAIEFDEKAVVDQAKHEDSDGYFGFLTGAEWQQQTFFWNDDGADDWLEYKESK